MTLPSRLLKEESEHLEPQTQTRLSEYPLMNYALTHVAQTVVKSLQHLYPVRDNANSNVRTIEIRAIEPEFTQRIPVESLTARELQVLQLIVEGNRNPAIAQKLYISEGTVKSHVRNIFQKLCVEDRTLAAVRALRSGLVH